MTAQELIDGLHGAFGYTRDNNRDVVGDTLFPIGEVLEELIAEFAYQFLIAYIIRDMEMIENQLENNREHG